MAPPNLVAIRPRSTADIPQLIEILSEVYTQTGYPVDGPSSFASKLEPDNVVRSTVALHDGCLAGHVQLLDISSSDSAVTKAISAYQPIDSYLSLVSLFVDPKIQRKGIGAQLIEEAVIWSRSQGKRLALVVLGKDAAAIRMYERMGWVRVFQYVFTSSYGVGYEAFAYVAPE